MNLMWFLPINNLNPLSVTGIKPQPTSTPTAQPERPTHGQTAAYTTSQDVSRPSSESSEKLTSVPTTPPKTPAALTGRVTSTGSPLVTSGETLGFEVWKFNITRKIIKTLQNFI